ncbi:MAG: hypothetical protein KC535_05900, partial [Nanoarchaeota archaeon]|nr:hypothetical protein [Nanoarchaeota archaeon]
PFEKNEPKWNDDLKESHRVTLWQGHRPLGKIYLKDDEFKVDSLLGNKVNLLYPDLDTARSQIEEVVEELLENIKQSIEDVPDKPKGNLYWKTISESAYELKFYSRTVAKNIIVGDIYRGQYLKGGLPTGEFVKKQGMVMEKMTPVGDGVDRWFSRPNIINHSFPEKNSLEEAKEQYCTRLKEFERACRSSGLFARR